jgi:hypothetical protein
MTRRAALPGVAPFEPASPYGIDDEYTKPISVEDLFPLVLKTQTGEFSDEPTKRGPVTPPTREHDPTLCDCLVIEPAMPSDGDIPFGLPESVMGWSASWVKVGHELDGQGEDDGVPKAAEDYNTGPLGFTVIGPLLSPRRPATKP